MRLVAAHGSGKPRGLAGGLMLGGAVAVGVVVAPLAVCVYETGFVIVGPVPRCDRLFGDRFAGGGQPLFPFCGRRGLVLGQEQVVVAERAAAVLGLEQPQRGPSQWGLVAAAPFVPVVGQGGVIR